MTNDQKWISKGEVWGEWLTHPQLLPAGRETVYLVRGGNGHARFYAPGPGLGGSGLRQVGPHHKSIVAATTWAFAHSWVDPDFTMLVNGEPVNGSADATVEVWNHSDPRGRDGGCTDEEFDRWVASLAPVVA